MEGEEQIPFREIAEIDYQNTVFLFGVLPLVLLGILALIWATLYFYRRGKNWNELGEAMRADEDTVQTPDFPTSQQLSEMDPTQPSQRLDKDRINADPP